MADDGSLKDSLSDALSLFKSKYRSGRETLRGIFYGMTVHELDLEIRKEKSQINNIFMLIVFGDLVGLPLLPPYYSMRLLPFIIPHIETWKRSILRERDISDRISMDI